MNNKQEFFNEEKYQKTKEKMNIIGIILLCVGLVLSILGFVTTFVMDIENDLFFLMFFGTPMLFIGIFLVLTSHMREITSFHMQQTMPVVQEGMEKMAPTIGKVGSEIAKDMAPAYGEVAKEVAKGIKEGINEADKKDN